MRRTKGYAAFGIVIASIFVTGLVFADTTPWTSEENPPAMCQAPNAAYYMECSGSYCDNVRMVCDQPSKSKQNSEWTAWASEEEGYNMCPSGAVVTGIACSGSYCDNESLYCTYLSGASMHNCNWYGSFSEELPQNYATCPGIQYMTGVFCSGDYCDNQWIYCCDI